MAGPKSSKPARNSFPSLFTAIAIEKKREQDIIKTDLVNYVSQFGSPQELLRLENSRLEEHIRNWLDTQAGKYHFQPHASTSPQTFSNRQTSNNRPPPNTWIHPVGQEHVCSILAKITKKSLRSKEKPRRAGKGKAPERNPIHAAELDRPEARRPNVNRMDFLDDDDDSPRAEAEGEPDNINDVVEIFANVPHGGQDEAVTGVDQPTYESVEVGETSPVAGPSSSKRRRSPEHDEERPSDGETVDDDSDYEIPRSGKRPRVDQDFARPRSLTNIASPSFMRRQGFLPVSATASQLASIEYGPSTTTNDRYWIDNFTRLVLKRQLFYTDRLRIVAGTDGENTRTLRAILGELEELREGIRILERRLGVTDCYD